jgi:hypothetical protein
MVVFRELGAVFMWGLAGWNSTLWTSSFQLRRSVAVVLACTGFGVIKIWESDGIEDRCGTQDLFGSIDLSIILSTENQFPTTRRIEMGFAREYEFN